MFFDLVETSVYFYHIPFLKNFKVSTKLDNFLLNKIFIQILLLFCTKPYIFLGILPNLLDIPREDMGKKKIVMGYPEKGKDKKGKVKPINFITTHHKEGASNSAQEREAKWHELFDPE